MIYAIALLSILSLYLLAKVYQYWRLAHYWHNMAIAENYRANHEEEAAHFLAFENADLKADLYALTKIDLS